MEKIDYSKLKKPDYNSPNLDAEQVYAYLTLGYRKPQNDYEKALLKEINEIEDEGYTVDIPSNGI